MEDVLEVYQRPLDPKRPLVCRDEISKQVLADSRPPLPMQPGQSERYDDEYVRHGTLSLYAALETQTGAVLGKTFTREALAALAGLDEPELEPLLAGLVRKEVLTIQADPVRCPGTQLRSRQSSCASTNAIVSAAIAASCASSGRGPTWP